MHPFHDNPSLERPADDASLLAAAQRGDHTAFTAIIERHARLVHGYLRARLVRLADAEDLGQEVFLRVFQNIRDFDAKLSFSAWIYRITHNLMVSRIRSHGSRGTPVAFEM